MQGRPADIDFWGELVFIAARMTVRPCFGRSLTDNLYVPLVDNLVAVIVNRIASLTTTWLLSTAACEQVGSVYEQSIGDGPVLQIGDLQTTSS